MDNSLFNRTELLLGREAMERIRSKRVIIFGVGGVGSWCAECLVREGITHLTLVDSDVVCVTNCNRQLMATTRTIGVPKVEALRSRLLDINPEAEIVALQKNFSKENAEEFHIERYDYIIDAIDSLRDKISLIIKTLSQPLPCRERSRYQQGAEGDKVITTLPTMEMSRYQQSTEEPKVITPLPTRERLGEGLEGLVSGCLPVLFSSMGAALRIDPTKVRVSEFWKVKGDPLAAAMRSAMRRNKLFPARKFLCVHSEEQPLKNLGTALKDGSQTFTKVQTNGSLCHITAIFGMTLAGLVVQDINKTTNN